MQKQYDYTSLVNKIVQGNVDNFCAAYMRIPSKIRDNVKVYTSKANGNINYDFEIDRIMSEVNHEIKDQIKSDILSLKEELNILDFRLVFEKETNVDNKETQDQVQYKINKNTDNSIDEETEPALYFRPIETTFDPIYLLNYRLNISSTPRDISKDICVHLRSLNALIYACHCTQRIDNTTGNIFCLFQYKMFDHNDRISLRIILEKGISINNRIMPLTFITNINQ